MSAQETLLSKQEQQWIMERRVTRQTDNKEVQIYPMGAERYLASVLFENKTGRFNIREDMENKEVLVIPGYGNSAFLIAQAGAKSVTVYDKDPVTIAWIKAFKKYYHFREQKGSKTYPSIGELLAALTRWYPPLIKLPSGQYTNPIHWALHPNTLRRTYIHYILSLVQLAIQSRVSDAMELKQTIHFHSGTIDNLITSKEKHQFDTAFVPYLLGVKNGIENETDIVTFIEQMLELVPRGSILVTPSQNTKEFHVIGQRYFETTSWKQIQSIPKLKPYIRKEYRNWFRTQGLAVFGTPD